VITVSVMFVGGVALFVARDVALAIFVTPPAMNALSPHDALSSQ
jgi:hypothetical protein